MLDPWSLAQGRWKKKLYLALRLRNDLARASAIHFTNAIERDQARGVGLGTPSLVEKYIIDLREFDHLPPAGTFRNLHPSLQGQRLVLFLGRIHPKKGLDLLLPAFAAASERCDAMLVLAGPVDEDYRQALRKRIDELKIGHRVLFTGALLGPQRLAAFAEADLFVLPSYQENTGIAVIESLAAGTPVLISDRVNIYPEIARADVGTVVPAELSALTAAIDRCLGARQSRQALADRSRAFVREQYDRLALAQRWRGHYQQLIDSFRGNRR
jgi:glycosyltransferase involved in cell wall biosynthesis